MGAASGSADVAALARSGVLDVGAPLDEGRKRLNPKHQRWPGEQGLVGQDVGELQSTLVAYDGVPGGRRFVVRRGVVGYRL